MLSKTEIIKIATAEASRILVKYRVENTVPVNIYKIIEDSGVVLNFQKLDKLAGAYIPETNSSSAGILINENLPITRQRYTAAHELCHFIRKDSASIDTSSELFMNDYKREIKEQIAEEFASCILMPRKLILNILSQIGVNNIKEISPISVYTLSLRMDTSYQATVNRLATLKMITEKKYADLGNFKPKNAKDIYGSDGLETSWNNVWNITIRDNNSIIYPIKGDKIVIELEENPSTGYKWLNIPIIESLYTHWEPFNTDREVMGSSGLRYIKFNIKNKEDIILNLIYNRPWLGNSNSISELKINIVVQSKRHGIIIEQLIA